MPIKDPIHCERIASRDVRALTEVMTVCNNIGRARGAADLYIVVTQSGNEYLVDIREGACECSDAQYNLPTDDGRQTCKHVARITYETGMRPIPHWVERDRLDDQLLAAEHVTGEPRFVHIDVETDVEANTAPRAIADGGETLEDGPSSEDIRPANCSCLSSFETLPCWPCWRNGHHSPNPEVDS